MIGKCEIWLEGCQVGMSTDQSRCIFQESETPPSRSSGCSDHAPDQEIVPGRSNDYFREALLAQCWFQAKPFTAGEFDP